MRASDRAYATLVEQIQSGHLAPGAIIAEVEQASRLGVSRTPLREAIGRLVADGLVVQRSPRVTVVSDIDATDIRELFEVRRALEESAARLAAVRGNAATFEDLAERLGAFTGLAGGRSESALDLDDYYATIGEFDTAVDACVGNDYLTAALRTVRTHLVRVRRLARDNPGRIVASASEHRLIASAIAAHDPDLAAHATHVHLHNALSSILATLSSSAGESIEGAA